jgi:hypothetical protein
MYHRHDSLVSWYAVEGPPSTGTRVLHGYVSVAHDRTICGKNLPWCINPLSLRGTEQHCPDCFPGRDG